MSDPLAQLPFVDPLTDSAKTPVKCLPVITEYIDVGISPLMLGPT
nr:MAG TPA: hypothetical protein [Caudoviricetes sp.]